MNRLNRIATMLTFSAALGATTICAISPASAADGKGYNGSNCVRIGGGVVSFASGAISNLSTITTMRVECPIINDSSAGINHSWLKVRDRSTTRSIGCVLNSMASPAGTSPSSSPTDNSRGSIGDVETLVSGGVAGGSGFRYFLSCTIPPRRLTSDLPSQIEQYFAEEP